MSGGMPGLNMPSPKDPSLPPALANYLGPNPHYTELLARQEDYQLLAGLNSGNISLENTMKQLTNPELQLGWRSMSEWGYTSLTLQ